MKSQITEDMFERKDWGTEFDPYPECFWAISRMMEELEKQGAVLPLNIEILNTMHRYTKFITNAVMETANLKLEDLKN